MRKLMALAFMALAGVALGQDAAPPVKVHYVFEVADPKERAAKVEMTVKNAPDGDLVVALPAWRPGSYRLQDYHERIKDVTASSKDGALEVEAVNERTWKVKGTKSLGVTVRYQVTPRDAGDKHRFLEGPGTWLYAMEHKNAPCTVLFKLPEGWRAGSGLTDMGDGIFGARDYDTFADCPIELGTFELHAFEHDGVKYELVVRTPGEWNANKLIAAIKKIVREQHSIFGGAPFDRYVFLYRWGPGASGGGLEHLNSTDIGWPYDLIKVDAETPASITSHEYFHLWNVKRIRPLELGPFDYTQPVRSVHLWMCEGVTSYYGDLTLARTRIWSEERYFRHLADEIQTLQNNPVRKTTSVEEASRTVWDRDRRRPRPTLDYYNKGEILGLLLDFKIRQATKGDRSLDDVMRLLWTRYVVEPSKAGKGPIGVGFPNDGILKALNEVSGTDFGDFYAKHIRGTDELPYEEILGAAGLDAKIVPRSRIASAVRFSRVGSVPGGSEDEAAGLKPGDRIIEVAEKAVGPADSAEELIGRMKPGDEVAIKVRRAREEEPIELKLKVIAGEEVSVSLARAAQATAAQKRMVDSWLKKGDY